MILYNVTVSVDPLVEADWLEWMQNVHIPDVMKTGMFVENKFFRLLSIAEDESGATYSVQYFSENMANYQRYKSEFAPSLQAEHFRRYGNSCVAFRSLLESMD